MKLSLGMMETLQMIGFYVHPITRFVCGKMIISYIGWVPSSYVQQQGMSPQTSTPSESPEDKPHLEKCKSIRKSVKSR